MSSLRIRYAIMSLWGTKIYFFNPAQFKISPEERKELTFVPLDSDVECECFAYNTDCEVSYTLLPDGFSSSAHGSFDLYYYNKPFEVHYKNLVFRPLEVSLFSIMSVDDLKKVLATLDYSDEQVDYIINEFIMNKSTISYNKLAAIFQLLLS